MIQFNWGLQDDTTKKGYNHIAGNKCWDLILWHDSNWLDVCINGIAKCEYYD